MQREEDAGLAVSELGVAHVDVGVPERKGTVAKGFGSVGGKRGVVGEGVGFVEEFAARPGRGEGGEHDQDDEGDGQTIAPDARTDMPAAPTDEARNRGGEGGGPAGGFRGGAGGGGIFHQGE